MNLMQISILIFETSMTSVHRLIFIILTYKYNIALTVYSYIMTSNKFNFVKHPQFG